MASKAMNWFRRHQKKILAIVTIGTMLIFIVGDAVQAMGRGAGGRSRGIIGWFENLFGGSKEDTVIRLGSTNYNAEQLSQLQHHRQFALEVMSGVSNEGQRRFLESLGFKEDEMKDQNKVQQKLFEMEGKDPTIRQAQTQRENCILNQIQPSLRTFAMINQVEWIESISEYLVMRNKANELGVTITNSAVQEDLLKVGMGRVSLDEINALIRNSARARGALDMAKLDSVLSVLADEVRVSIAKQVTNEDFSKTIIENAYLRQGMPFPGANKLQLTPSDLWNNYVDVKTSLSTGILPLKVEDYLSRVAEPTDAEKQEYFEKYKKEYPSSDRDTPGFKIPPMYRIGFVFADMKDGQPARKYYNAQVEAWDRIAPLNALAELAQSYETKKRTTYQTVQPFIEFATSKAAGSPWVRVYRWQSQQDHGHVATILGHLGIAASQIGTFSPGNAFVMTLSGEAVPASQNQLISAMQGIAGAISLPGMLQPAMLFRTGTKEAYVPFSVVAPALIEQRTEAKAREYLNNDMTELTTNLNDYGKKYSEYRGKVLRKLAAAGSPPLYKDEPKQTLQEYLTRFTAARGLSYYETKDFRSREGLLNEPNERLLNTFVKPLYVDAFERASAREIEEQVKSILVQNEINGQKPKMFDAFNSTVYDRRNKNKEIVLTWVTDSSDPRTPDFKEAEAAVVRAWKMEKARPTVEEEAQKITKDVSQADNYRKLIDMKGYAPGQTIAKFSEPELTSTTPMPMYQRCPLPKAVDNPPDDFVKQCLDKLKKKGDTLVIADKSKAVYYVIYLSNRSEPKTDNPLDLEAFHNEVIRPSMTRQMLIEGMPFRSFVEQMQRSTENFNWLEYLKALTGITVEKAKMYNEALTRYNR